jgi:uncharacterized protein (DUF736 family)
MADTYEQKDMTGSLFDNDKAGNDARPDMRGSVTIDGTKYSISAWHNESKGGKKYVSLKVSEWQERPAQPQVNGSAQTSLDDNIPF